MGSNPVEATTPLAVTTAAYHARATSLMEQSWSRRSVRPTAAGMATGTVSHAQTEGRIPGGMEPVRCLGGKVAGETVLFVAGRSRFRGISAIEPRPPRTIPQRKLPGWLFLLSFTITNQPFRV